MGILCVFVCILLQTEGVGTRIVFWPFSRFPSTRAKGSLSNRTPLVGDTSEEDPIRYLEALVHRSINQIFPMAAPHSAESAVPKLCCHDAA